MKTTGDHNPQQTESRGDRGRLDRSILSLIPAGKGLKTIPWHWFLPVISLIGISCAPFHRLNQFFEIVFFLHQCITHRSLLPFDNFHYPGWNGLQDRVQRDI